MNGGLAFIKDAFLPNFGPLVEDVALVLLGLIVAGLLCRGGRWVFAHLLARLRVQPLSALFGLLLVFCAFAPMAVSKFTNGVGAPMMMLVPGAGPQLDPLPLLALADEITTNAVQAGFIAYRVGTGETFDFTPPTNATVVADWERHGAATTWRRIAPADWSFPFGTNAVSALTLLPSGEIRLCTTSTNAVFLPLGASLSIAPRARWNLLPSGDVSRAWWCVTPTNSLVCTLEGALWNRGTNATVDVQAEFLPDGRFAYRYDLSRLPDDADVATVHLGARNAGAGEIFSPSAAELRALTSLHFAPVYPSDLGNPDRDGDGLSTLDELRVHNTDPSNPDTDEDGLSDFEEVAAGGDPLDPYSNGSIWSDGFASALGDADPYAHPAGSTNTVYEHVLYSGSTNGAVALPSSSDETAVLRVTATASGGSRPECVDLLVDGRPVPLLGGEEGAEILVAVPKGRRVPLHLRANGPAPRLAYDSDDFAAGELPTMREGGWILFPRTVASPACIHELSRRTVLVSLSPGRDMENLACSWYGSGAVRVQNLPPLAAKLTGTCDANLTSQAGYVLSHPDYLFGTTMFSQTVRFCPALDPDDPPEPGSPEDELLHYYDGQVEHYDVAGCGCLENGCPPDCACSCHDREPPGEFDSGEDERTPYTNAVARVTPLDDVLLLHQNPPDARTAALVVPVGRVEGCTCTCPDHATNFVSLACAGERVRVSYAGTGEEFLSTCVSTNVQIRGVHPSESVGDAPVAFSRNGTLCDARFYTVLGVDIRHRTLDLDALNARNASFGVPFVVCAQPTNGLELLLRTDVDLPFGTIRLAVEGATARVRVWRPLADDTCELLLDTNGRSELHYSIANWNRMARETSSGRTPRVYVTSDAPGGFNLVFGYAGLSGGRAFAASDVQRVTAVNPPLLPDYNRDGRVSAVDVRSFLTGSPFYFWSNRDTWRGDDAFAFYGAGTHLWPPTLPCNGDDAFVNGRNDVVNLCPFAVDLSRLLSAWGTEAVTCEFLTGDPGQVRFVPIRVRWNSVGEIFHVDQRTCFGDELHEAPLLSTTSGVDGETGYILPPSLLELGAEKAGAMAVEFASPGNRTLRLRVRDRTSGRTLFESKCTVTVLDVHSMYRWINLDHLCGETTDSKYATRSLVSWPDSAHADANVVFVHGYNMHPQEAWDWSQAMFKRLWWSGMDAGFTAVLWRGNETQVWIPGKNCYATVNYHQNVLNALRSAEGFKTAMDELPGARKFYVAHSLGNMLVSEAAQFHGLQYEKYFMLNAAVPVEAYDPDGGVTSESKERMTPSEWRPYADHLRSTHWYELFDEGDARRRLTWKGRFKDVERTVNFFSSSDEVVANGDDNVEKLFSRNYAWYKQEQKKGELLVSTTPEAGWSFNEENYHKTAVVRHNHGEPVYGLRRYTPQEALDIAQTNLMTRPFFRDFRESSVYGASGSLFLELNPDCFRHMLSHGISVESFAVGANPVLKWGMDVTSEGVSNASKDRNIDMATKCGRSDNVDWIHSYFIQRSLCDTYRLYLKLSELIGRSSKGRVE